MTTKIAKLWVNHVSMSGDPSNHIAYLTNGHQLAPGEQVLVWTKSIPKKCKDSNAALVAHWHGIHEQFIDARSTSGSKIHHNAKVTARQFVINLPNDIGDDQVHQLAKVVLKDFPRHIPVSLVLHRTSNRGKLHTHLQGIFSYRSGGYGAIQEPFRMDITTQMKNTVTSELTSYGYHVDHGEPGSINSKERKWLNNQGTVEKRRNPRFLLSLASTATSPRLQAYCSKQAVKISARVGGPSSVDSTLNLLDTMTDLMSIYQPEAMNPQDQSGSGHLHGTTTEPLTQKALDQALQKVRRWKPHTKTVFKNLGS